METNTPSSVAMQRKKDASRKWEVHGYLGMFYR